MFRRVLLAVLLAVPLSCASSGSTTDSETGLPAESQVHTVTVTVDCDGNCESANTSGFLAGTTQRTFTCTHGEPLRLLVTPQGRGSVVSVTISIDGAVVATESRANVLGGGEPLTVRAICE